MDKSSVILIIFGILTGIGLRIFFDIRDSKKNKNENTKQKTSNNQKKNKKKKSKK